MEDGGDLKRRIAMLLVKIDPMRIYFKDFDNRDEYDSEAEEVARLLSSCATREACLDAVQKVFERHFGDLVVSRALNFEALADALWELRRDLQGP